MAKKEFILQGFTARTHLDAVRELFDGQDIRKFFLNVAYVNEGGVEKIEAKLKARSANLAVFAGVRNETTSHQGLACLHSVGGKLYTVDTGSRLVIFHPKLYMVRGKDRARLLVGSADPRRLNNNGTSGRF